MILTRLPWGLFLRQPGKVPMDSPRTRPRLPSSAGSRPSFQIVAEIEIDAVAPSERGFTLTGQGGPPDRAEYRLDVHFELPLDARTRSVLGELLSQSDLTISRRALATHNS
jgi:hypothetical protein